MTDIACNLETVKENIALAAQRAGRKESDIDLLAVTKTIPIERIKIVEDLGMHRFGENRVQEFLKKCDFFTKKTSWDIIGRLQSNKVKYIIEKINLVHSLCTKSTATEMQRLCLVKDTYIDCLVEVNVGAEGSKDGLDLSELPYFLDEIAPLDRVRVKGLMTVAPFAYDAEEVRPIFRSLKKQFDMLSARKADNFEMRHLSMGMSGDYAVAIEEGATIVRVGSAIFGSRS